MAAVESVGAAIVTAIAGAVGWAVKKVNDHDTKIAVLESKLDGHTVSLTEIKTGQEKLISILLHDKTVG